MRTFPLLRRTALLACLALSDGGSAETLTVVSWGGSYEQASRKAILEPFSKETGIDIRVEVYNGPGAGPRAGGNRQGLLGCHRSRNGGRGPRL